MDATAGDGVLRTVDAENAEIYNLLPWLRERIQRELGVQS
jgi:hypothetical protein